MFLSSWFYWKESRHEKKQAEKEQKPLRHLLHKNVYNKSVVYISREVVKDTRYGIMLKIIKKKQCMI